HRSTYARMSFLRQPTRMIHKKLRSPLDECCPNPRRLAATEKPAKRASARDPPENPRTAKRHNIAGLSRTAPPFARVPSRDSGPVSINLGPLSAFQIPGRECEGKGVGYPPPARFPSGGTRQKRCHSENRQRESNRLARISLFPRAMMRCKAIQNLEV